MIIAEEALGQIANVRFLNNRHIRSLMEILNNKGPNIDPSAKITKTIAITNLCSMNSLIRKKIVLTSLSLFFGNT